jgi:hypothetical protein
MKFALSECPMPQANHVRVCEADANTKWLGHELGEICSRTKHFTNEEQLDRPDGVARELPDAFGPGLGLRWQQAQEFHRALSKQWCFNSLRLLQRASALQASRVLQSAPSIASYRHRFDDAIDDAGKVKACRTVTSSGPIADAVSVNFDVGRTLIEAETVTLSYNSSHGPQDTVRGFAHHSSAREWT